MGAYQLAITIGILLAAVVNNATHTRNDTGSYRIPIGLQLAFSAILIAGMHFLPETPRYLIRRGDMTGATRSLAVIRRQLPNDTAIITELEEIRANYQYEISLGSTSFWDCFRKGMRGRLLTGMLLQMLQQFTGTSHGFSRSNYLTGRSLTCQLLQASTSFFTTVLNTLRTPASTMSS